MNEISQFRQEMADQETSKKALCKKTCGRLPKEPVSVPLSDQSEPMNGCEGREGGGSGGERIVKEVSFKCGTKSADPSTFTINFFNAFSRPVELLRVRMLHHLCLAQETSSEVPGTRQTTRWDQLVRGPPVKWTSALWPDSLGPDLW